MLTRAYDPQCGEIFLNSVPLSAHSEAALRAMTSVVTQRVHLFSATLRDNLLLASPESSDAALIEVLHRVGLQALLMDDQGLNAWIGEGDGRFLVGSAAV